MKNMLPLILKSSEIIFFLWMFITYLLVWIRPSLQDASKIHFLSVLITFEFIMLIATAFFHTMPFRWVTFAILCLAFGLFAFIFNLYVGNNHIMWVFAALVITRALNSKVIVNEQAAGATALMFMIYFPLLLAAVLLPEKVPQFGLTKEFLTQSGYYGEIGKHGWKGFLADAPHLTIGLGALYFGIVTFFMCFGRLIITNLERMIMSK